MRKYILFVLFTLMFSSNLYSQNGWVRYYTGYSFVIEDVFFINNTTGWCVGGKHILKSTNGGANWIKQADTNTISQYANFKKVFFLDENTGWVAGGGGTPFPFCMDINLLWKTTNGGNSWFSQPAPTVDDNTLWDVIATDPNTVYVCDAGTEQFCIYSSGALFRSSDGGNSWSNMTSKDNLFGFNSVSFIDINTGWAVGNKRGDTPPTFSNVYKTTNAGLNWEIVYSDTTEFDYAGGIQFLNSTIGYLKFGSRNLKSTDGGISWFEFNANQDSLNNLFFIDPSTGWAIGNNNNIIKRTTNNGVNWINQYTQGNSFFNLSSIFFKNNLYGWASSFNGYIYATGTGGIVSINNISTELPKAFSLHQNYPNPFNPSTMIRFDLPKQGLVSLKVFDISGREVAELVKEELQSGVYEYSFDGTGLGSGVYFYKLESNNITETKRMVLVK